ncbi:hypothetical protein DGWBC_0110 [Dehalogenimonas sp. WBC-2]|nr:hypothetical protein DGWBC_0110 [Dehalogenimonas sp. WBC-2]
MQANLKLDYFPTGYGMVKSHIIKCNRNETVAWKFLICGDICKFVDPFQHIAAEQKTIVVEVLW